MINYHHPEAQRILELPIYRCTEEQHYSEQEARYESAAQWTKQSLQMLTHKCPKFAAQEMEICRREWFRREAYPWDFNQIVGWIRLYAWTGNIAAYLFFVSGRIAKTMIRKRFIWKQEKFLEMRVFSNQSSTQILEKLKKRLSEESDDSSRVLRLYVDTGVLDVLGPHIDWVALTRRQKAS